MNGLQRETNLKMIIFIPIKHNSQRVPKKNFRPFGSTPLFKHTLLKFKDHKVFVDTDSDVIYKSIKEDKQLANVTVFKREALLVGDTISVCELIKSFIIKFKIKEPIAQIHVTSPFLKLGTLENAFTLIHDYDSVASCNSHNSRFWRKEKYGFCPVNHNPVKMEQTQDLPSLFEENSAFYIFKPEVILNYNNRIGKNPLFYPIGHLESIDIDTEDDWGFASKLNEMKL
jgi:CMP-N-acetylneuraminic acid synthetase